MSNELEIKTERLVQMLSAENLGGVLLNSQHNFAWLTGGKSNVINASTETGVCFLFVRADGKRFVLVNNIEMPRILAEEVSAQDFEPIEFSWQAEKASGNLIFEKAKSLCTSNGEIVTDLLLNPNIRSVENLISRCRYSLTDGEIERYRQLGKDSAVALGKVFGEINAGESEIEIARKTKNELAQFNIDSVVTIVGADERIANFRHPIPTENVWKKLLLISVCGKRGGLIASLSRIACIGEIPAELKRRTAANADVFAEALAATQIGATGAEIYAMIDKAYAENGFAGEINKHHQGGAIGYKTRDWVAHPNSAEIVVENQAFAWNPTVTGTKIEETAILTANGFEIVTTSADFPQISANVNGQNIALPNILEL
ncbi:MAG: M24 family metallopeptidase [Pyrinomonadaceae bacterium]|nr:M24 family metallopeptidase [Pyrinomonadaceae bacterium]